MKKLSINAAVYFVLCLMFSNTALAVGLTTYFHEDHLGSPVYASNDFGEVLWQEGYEPYGEKINNSPPALANDIWFTGKPHDDDTGLTYMNARYYDPAIGRFMSVDPVGFVAANPMSFNRYLYVNNNPYKYNDPDGEFLNFIAGGGWAAAQNIAIQNLEIALGVREEFSYGELAAETVLGAATSGLSTSKNVARLTHTTAKYVDKVTDAKKLAKVCCFLAGTKILTIDGYKNIEEIELGELVYSKDEETGDQDWKPVITLFEKYRIIYQLNVVSEGGDIEEIYTTDDHPFYVIGKGFVGTIDLNVGDLIETQNGGWVAVQSVVNTEQPDKTYNLEVRDFHTYYATELGLWVHNNGNCDWGWVGNVGEFMADNASRLNKKLGDKIGQGRLPFERSKEGIEKAKQTITDTLNNSSATSKPFTNSNGDTVMDVFSEKTGFTVRVREDGVFDTLIDAKTDKF